MSSTIGVRLPPHTCPHCGIMLSAAATLDNWNPVPKADDPSVCIECHKICFYQADMTLRKPKPGELEMMLLKEPELCRDIAFLQLRIRSTGPRT